ncbi:MAG: hypothetical protein VX589_16450 [Myxococcota bacterium]|nr:hypothetical protein [Myxococcota bacterium]
MVKKIKRINKRPKVVRGGSRNWLVPFDKDGQAAIYIHKHGDTNDHSECGPVVMCCERAIAPYREFAPDLHGTVDRYLTQDGFHVSTWLDNGVGAIYFVLCDLHDKDVGYQFGLSGTEARALLQGRCAHDEYRHEQQRFKVVDAS